MWVCINFLLKFFILIELHMNEFDKSVVQQLKALSDKLAQIDAWKFIQLSSHVIVDWCIH